MSTTTMIDRIRQASDKLVGTDDSVLSYAHFKSQQAIKDFVEADQKTSNLPAGHRYDSFGLNRLVKAEAQIRLWHEVVATSSPSREDVDIQITHEGLIETAKRNGTDVLNVSGRSTDAFSNAIADVERDVKAEFIRSFAGDLKINEVSRW